MVLFRPPLPASRWGIRPNAPRWGDGADSAPSPCLTRERVAYSLGGGLFVHPSQIISESKRRIETGEAVFEGSRRDAPNLCLTF